MKPKPKPKPLVEILDPAPGETDQMQKWVKGVPNPTKGPREK
jgi:hypothetical protein